jgi:hypothetical protein
MMAISVAVAFQTISQMWATSLNCTRPAIQQAAAPNAALQPMPRRLGLATTNISVPMKMARAVAADARGMAFFLFHARDGHMRKAWKKPY